MEGLKSWVLALCISAVAASLLQGLLPEKKAFSGIKLVVSLYILVTLLSPIKAFSAAQLRAAWELPAAPLTAGDADGAILRQAEGRLEELLADRFVGQGLQVEKVEVRLALDEGRSAVLEGVRVWSEEPPGLLQAVAEEFFGLDVGLTVEKTDGTG